MNVETLVNVKGNLRDTYAQIVPGSMRHIDEILRELRTNTPLDWLSRRQRGIDSQQLWQEHYGNGGMLVNFHAAGSAIYAIVDGKPILGITRGEEHNLILQNAAYVLDKLEGDFGRVFLYSTQHIRTDDQRIYRPSFKEVEPILKDPTTTIIDLAKVFAEKDSLQKDRNLTIKVLNYEWNTSPAPNARWTDYWRDYRQDYSQLNPEVQKLFEAFCGPKDELEANMKLFASIGHKYVNVGVLTPYDLRLSLGSCQNSEKAIVMATKFSLFPHGRNPENDRAHFSTSPIYSHEDFTHIRGVLKNEDNTGKN